MGYLERNAAIIAEINNKTASGEVILLRRGHVALNEARTTRFESVGSFSSPSVNNEIHMGVKTYNAYLGGDHLVRMMFARDLAMVSAIAERIPELADEVPTFFALLETKAEEVQGFLMEDFSKDGTEGVDTVNHIVGRDRNLLPDALKILIPKASDIALATASFRVGAARRRRLGDFNSLPNEMSLEEWETTFGGTYQDIRKRRKEFTVFVAEKI